MSKKVPPRTPQPAPPLVNKTVNQPLARPDAAPEQRKMPLYIQLALALTAIVFILYFNTLQNGFVLDDIIMVKDNTMVAKGFAGIGELLSTPHMRGYLIIPNDTYRPLSLVMFAIEHQFFGLNPAPYHFFNVLTFAICVLLLFRFLHLFMDGRNLLAAFAGALIFAIHPIHTEVVANIKSRDELLCFLFAFLALNLFMRYVKEGKMQQLLLGLVSLYLSIISKENTITFIGVIPVLFYLFKNDNKKRSAIITGASLLVPILFIAIRHMVLDKYDANTSTAIEFIDNALVKAPSFPVRIATAIFISGKYLLLLFIPYPLLCNYSYNSIPFKTFADIGVILSLAAYGGMIYYAIKTLGAKQKDPLVFAILYFLMTIALFNNLFILIGAQMGERFLFMPSAGLCMAVAFAADRWIIPAVQSLNLNGLKTPRFAGIFIPVLAISGGMVIARNKDWKDNVNLYRIDLEKSPDDCRLSYYLGTALAETQYNEATTDADKQAIDKEAIMHLRRALSMYPDFAEANAEMGRVFDRLQQYDSAEYYDLRALQLNPKHSIATNNLGSVYLAERKYELAAATFKKAIENNPAFNLAYFNLARTLNQLKQYDSAIYYYNKTLEFTPGYLDAYQEKGMAYFSMGKYEEAEASFKEVLKLKPDESTAMNNLGAIYLNTKNYGAAIEQFNKSIALNPNSENAYSNLGRAYYFNKQYQPAIETFVKQINLNNKSFENIPYIALSYKELGNMQEAKKYEAIAQHYYSNFRL